MCVCVWREKDRQADKQAYRQTEGRVEVCCRDELVFLNFAAAIISPTILCSTGENKLRKTFPVEICLTRSGLNTAVYWKKR